MSSRSSGGGGVAGRIARPRQGMPEGGAAESVTPRGHTFDELLERWVGYLEAVRGRRPATVARYVRVVRQLAADQAVGQVEEISFDVLEGYVKSLFYAGRAASTRAAAVSAIRAFCEYAVVAGALEANPALRLAGVRVYQEEPPALTQSEVTRLIFGPRGPGWLPADWRAARDQVLLAVSYAAGLRVSEVGALRLDGVAWHEDLERWSILLRAAKRAEADVRVVLRDERISRMLGTWCTTVHAKGAGGSRAVFPAAGGSSSGRGLAPRTVATVFRRAWRAAGIERRGRRRITFHILRHSLATHAHEAGWETKAIARLLRHRSIKTTERYIHTRDERLDRLWRQRNPLRGRKKPPPDIHHLGRALATDLSEILEAASG